MMILSTKQQQLLEILSKESAITSNFYFSGGTVLAEYYLQHRYSEDLDFFCVEVFEPVDISVVFKKIQKEAGISRVHYEQSFNRNLFFLETDKEIIKTEFTYFPFPRIEFRKDRGELQIDSLVDIAVNKVFTIFQNPRSRDFVDLYCILQKKDWILAELIEKAQIKFETYIDLIQLGAQFVRADELKDYPRMLVDLKPKIWQEFFLKEAMKFKKEILE